MTDVIALGAPAAAAIGACLIPLAPTRRLAVASRVAAVVVAALAAAALIRTVVAAASGDPTGSLDILGAVFFGVNAFVGFCSAMLSPSHVSAGVEGFFREGPRWYYFSFFMFWAMLLAIPLAQNLGIAWTLVGVSTGVTGVLVAYAGTRRALEAGWKYLILTTLGLVIALFGILILSGSTEHPEHSLAALDWSSIAGLALPPEAATTALIFLTVGFAAKIGWAPVHHWLPDAHSQAPALVSAVLSAALLPTVVLVLWRTNLSLPGGPTGSPRFLLLAFGLLSLAFAVPFLSSPLPIKRLLAYSSLEHMGVIAIGIGFANPIATAGVLLHVCGHAVAKSLGFYATIPLLAAHPAAATHALRDAARTSPSAATGLGVSLGALSGLPPSPLFVSELLILVGGVAAGQVVVVAVAAVLLALAFVGLTRQTLEALFASARHPAGRADAATHPAGRTDASDKGVPERWWLPIVFTGLLVGLLGLAWYVFTLPGWTAVAEHLS